MARGAKKANIEFYGFEEVAKNLDKSRAEIESAVIESLKKSIEAPKQEMLSFMSQHRRTGRTEQSWTENIENNNGIIKMEIGFLAYSGNKFMGLPAIFLNLGGLHTRPYYFIDNAVNHNIDKMKQAQIDTLREVFEKCGIS